MFDAAVVTLIMTEPPQQSKIIFIYAQFLSHCTLGQQDTARTFRLLMEWH